MPAISYFNPDHLCPGRTIFAVNWSGRTIYAIHIWSGRTVYAPGPYISLQNKLINGQTTNGYAFYQLQLPPCILSEALHGENDSSRDEWLISWSLFIHDEFSCQSDEFNYPRTNSIAKWTNSIPKVANSFAKTCNSIAKLWFSRIHRSVIFYLQKHQICCGSAHLYS